MRAAKLAMAAQYLKKHSGASPPFTLAFMTDCTRAPNPELIARALPPNSAIVLRDYAHPDRHALARRLRIISAQRKCLLLVGADTELAKDVGADGVHSPNWHNSPPGFGISSVACHNPEELKRPAAMRADVIFLSPAFETKSHPGTTPLGLANFKRLAGEAPAPVLALGGVAHENSRRLRGPNIAGLAAISAFYA